MTTAKPQISIGVASIPRAHVPFRLINPETQPWESMTATTIYLDENQLRLLKHLAAEERQSDMAALIERVRRISNFPKCLAEHKLRWQGLSLTLGKESHY